MLSILIVSNARRIELSMGLCAILLLSACGSDGSANVAISTAANNQQNPQVTSDGAGGAIITWQDYRSGTNWDIYTQRVNSAGIPQWTADGVAISTAAGYQQYPQVTSDGTGGAIITWWDYRNGITSDIYAQRVNNAGVPQWTTNGVAISTAAGDQFAPQLISDGAGGAIITWSDFRSETNYDIYAQRVNSAGVPQWTANGAAISTAAGFKLVPQLISDGTGGAIIAWNDHRSGISNDIYAQRVNSAGVPQWTANGAAISTAAGYQNDPQLISDGTGGAIIAWTDSRNGSDYDIYVQRVNSAGASQWTADGVAISTAAYNQGAPQITSDGAGGAIFTWLDLRSGTNWDIYAQRVTSAGIPQWTADGVVVCTAANYQDAPHVISDGAGGAIIIWEDFRNGTNLDIYAQRVSSAGAPQWTADGVAISTAVNSQETPQLTSDGAGGAIITWQDLRNGTNYDIYAQGITASGQQ